MESSSDALHADCSGSQPFSCCCCCPNRWQSATPVLALSPPPSLQPLPPSHSLARSLGGRACRARALYGCFGLARYRGPVGTLRRLKPCASLSEQHPRDTQHADTTRTKSCTIMPTFSENSWSCAEIVTLYHSSTKSRSTRDMSLSSSTTRMSSW